MRSSKLTKLPARVAIILISLYRATFSAVFGGRCRFYPSCSDYARRALRKYGLWRGGSLAVWRLVRCNPFHPGGVDEP